MVANYYYPKNKQNLSLIIMLGGSNGGMREVDDRAKIISSHGYAVLALGYIWHGKIFQRTLKEYLLSIFLTQLIGPKGKKTLILIR